MEVNRSIPAWLDPSHPNFKRWETARNLFIERGKFVRSIIEQNKKVQNLSVLDLGSGEGGTANVFSQDNFVVSFDLSLIRLQRQLLNVLPKEGSYTTEKSISILTTDSSGSQATIGMTFSNLVNGTALQLPFSNQSFDLIIIQDVIEHLSETKSFITEVKRVLKPNGMIYLSTPNKYSIFNFISDPHFGLPVVSVLKRESIKKYFLKHFRKNDLNRQDIAQLLSLNELIKLFNNDFDLQLNTKFAVKELFNGNKGIVWSDFHLKLILFCKAVKLDRLLIKISNDKIGVLNKFFTPTYYIILKHISH
ncbi:MAG: class I SAM-dependent methyltransferase [Ignavibacterium sp.]|nr:class I SAM-dependent methyltransferase [Ignavibacterium sp.]